MEYRPTVVEKFKRLGLCAKSPAVEIDSGSSLKHVKDDHGPPRKLSLDVMSDVASLPSLRTQRRRSVYFQPSSTEQSSDDSTQCRPRRKLFSEVVKQAYFISRGTNRGRRHQQPFRQGKTREEILTRFRRGVKIVLLCINFSKVHSLRNRNDNDEISPFIKQVHFQEHNLGSDVNLWFDPTLYKANRQNRLSDEIKRILYHLPEKRTEQDIYSAQIALRDITAFAEYPIRMQRKIVECGHLERYEAKRMIVRQGHPAVSFYIILSGTVVVMVMDEDRKYARPVAYLYKGQTFGELAIINRTTRQSTVIAKESVELLTISVDDFHSIFMDGGVKNLNDPDHNRFLRNLSFLRDWPLKLMAKYPKKSVFHFFKRGELLVKDSQYSDWLIIVKSGSLTVMKKLVKVGPFEWRKGQVGDKYISNKLKRKKREKLKQWRKLVLPDLNVPLRSVERVSSACSQFEHPQKSGMLGSFPAHEKRTKIFEIIFSKKAKYLGSRRNMLSVVQQARLPPISPKTHTRMSENSYSICKPPDQREQGGEIKTTNILTSKRTIHSTMEVQATSHGDRISSHSSKEEKQEMMGFEQHIRTINQDLDSAINRKDPDDVTLADLNPEFVRIQTLTKGEIFGLSDLIFGQQASFFVVSNGAECILLDKGLYMENAPDSLLRSLRQELCPYPSAAELQVELQTSVDWKSYKENTLKSTMHRLRAERFV